MLVLPATGGCVCAERPSDAPRVLIWGTTAEPANLDPKQVQTSGARELLGFVHRGLLRFDDRGRVQPDRAARIPALVDSGTVTEVRWELKPTFWSDGRPVTADDVVRTWRFERGATAELVNARLARQVLSLESDGPDRFVARWPAPTLQATSPGVHTVASSTSVRDKTPVGNGPYRVERWTPGVELVLEPNPYWPGPGPVIPRVRVRFYASEDALVVGLVSGEVDAVGEAGGLGPAKANLLQTRLADSHRIHLRDGGLWVHLLLRADHPVTGDIACRRVLYRGLDRAALAKVYARGGARPAYGVLPNTHPANTTHRSPPAPSANDRQRCAERAQQYGPLTLQITAGSQAGADLAALLVDQAGELGIELRIQAVHFGLMNQRLREGQGPPLALYGWRIRPDWDGRSVFATDGRQNYGGWSDAALDAALSASSTATTTEIWTRSMRRVETRFLEVLPAIPLLHRQSLSVQPLDLHGFAPTGTQTPVSWNAETWRWSDDDEG